MKYMGATSTTTAHKSEVKVFVILLMALCLPGIWCSLSLADVSPITSSGLNTQVNLSSTPPPSKVQYDITGGTRVGTNLFQSFGNFNVPTNNIANFLNDSGLATSNILGRVTGGNPSSIFGTVQTTGFGNANLFLMNPSGIVFGPNASLNVGGSVTFTTANYLRLAEVNGTAGIFHADPAATSVLSSAPVAAFGFLGSNPAAIAVQGSTLSVQPGQSISLVGGNQGFTYTNPDTGATASVPGGVTITGGKLLAPGGQLNLASVASPGEVLAGALEYAPNINGQSVGALGAIQVSQNSAIDASGNGGGSVVIRGGQFVLDNSRISANVTGPGPVTNGVESIRSGIDVQVSQDVVIKNASILETNVSGTTSSVTYGGVHVQGDNIEIVGTGWLGISFPSSVGPAPIIRSDVQAGATGASSGNITLDANSILVTGFGRLETKVTGSATQPATGNAGDITLTANNNIELSGSTISSVISRSSGAAGNITLTSRYGSILESGNAPPPGATLKPGDPLPITNAIFNQSLSGTGKPGNITFSTPEGDTLLAAAIVNIQMGTLVQVAGGGELNFTANNLQLINNSSVQVDNFSTVKAGVFNVTLAGNLTLNSSRIITTARGPAQAADLNITAHDVLVTNGGLLSTETQSPAPGGNLKIVADTLELTSGGRLLSTSRIGTDPFNPGKLFTTSGAGGTINIQGLAGRTSSVLIDGPGSGIFTSTTGTGAAGNTNIAARSVTIQNDGTVSASTSGTAPTATGGSITVNATDQVTMTGNASITASSTGPADAGNIFVNAGQQLEMQNSSITTQASQASGGNINVQANDLIRLVNSTISTSVLGGTGSGGNITIDPNTVILQNSQILAQAVQGNGGNITITTPLFLADQTSVVSASSQFGLNGTVTIQSPTSNLSGTVASLPSSMRQAQSLQTGRCAALANSQSSSLIIAGRETIPTEPGGWLPSPFAFAGEGPAPFAGLAGPTAPQLAMADDTVSLRRLTPPGFLTQHFAETASTGCRA